MYTSFFGLNEKPFSITPDPRYLFMSERHGEALAHLVYGVTESGGFIQLTGEVGTGKTTLVRTLLQNRLPDNADVAVVLNPQLSATEFLATIVEELGVEDSVDASSLKSLTDALNRYLLDAYAEGRRVILIVDEAQNLAPSVLEQVRLLTNLETSKQKLLQIILIGQPELRELLSRNDLRQLAQRITGRYHLEPLSRQETAAYVAHRMKVAGALTDVFEAAALREIFRLTQGVPRLVNVICDRALLGSYSREQSRVSARMVRRAAAEVAGDEGIPAWRRWFRPMAAAATIVIAAGAAAVWTQRDAPPAVTEPVAVQGRIIPIERTAVTPEPIPEPEPTLEEQLDLATALTDESTAFSTLLDTWGLDTGLVCSDLSDLGFSCLQARGSLGSLRQLDRPAVLTLVSETGESHHVVLYALRGEYADISMGGVVESHRTGDLAELWLGQYLMVWQPPNGRSVALVPGVDDPNVAWLRQSLSVIDVRYSAPPLDSTVYDAGLERQVMAFQRDHRLDVDGLAGRQTQIIINGLLAESTMPRLTTARLAKD
ncbi:MAG: AAA family ATPase [Pseudomonadota bacterium]